MQKFTHEQLIQYVYGEASPILKLAIDKGLTTNTELKKEITKLKKTKKEMDILKTKKVTPKQVTVNAIMEYAKRSSKKK